MDAPAGWDLKTDGAALFQNRTVAADVEHYGKIVIALGETIRLVAEIDETIEQHGGFPLVGSQN